jgi:hypothetical protein
MPARYYSYRHKEKPIVVAMGFSLYKMLFVSPLMYRRRIAHFVSKGHDDDGKNQGCINNLLLADIAEKVVAQTIHSVGIRIGCKLKFILKSSTKNQQ